MKELVLKGVTHIIDMQRELDDRPLAEMHDVDVIYKPTDPHFQIMPPDLFQRLLEFGPEALNGA